MITDNLAPLFGGDKDAVRFRQGTVAAWDASTGANTISVAGGTLTDVPILNTGEAIALKTGHVVGLLAFGSSWFLLGRITTPGDPNFAAASVAFGGEGASVTNFSVTTSTADKVTDTMAVPDWADEAIVLATVNATVSNNSATGTYCTVLAVIDGVAGGGNSFGLAPTGDTSFNDLAGGSASAQRRITSLGSSISLAGRVYTSGATIPASASTGINLDAIAIFRSTV